MRPRDIPWCLPDLSGDEGANLAAAIAAEQIGPAGEFLDRFERMVAEAAGARHAVATASGTAALHVALLAAGIGPGQEVLVPAWTFVATANAVRHAGAFPVVLDIDPEHWQLDPAAVERFLAERCQRRGGGMVDLATGRPVTAICPVHLLGHPAPLDELRALADRYGLALVADAAQALGAGYRGRGIAAGTTSTVSFNANKIVTTGGGGAVLTDDDRLAGRVRYLINQAREHAREYRHGEVGFNYRMSNLHAAVGVAQLDRLDQFVKAKRRIHARYLAGLGDLPGLAFQAAAPWARPTRWFITAAVAADQAGTTAAELAAGLAGQGVQTGPCWTPLHLTGAHDGSAPWPSPVAERLAAQAIHLPCSVDLAPDQQDRVIEAIRGAVSQRSAA